MTTVDAIVQHIENTVTEWEGPWPPTGVKFISWSGEVSGSVESHADHVVLHKFERHGNRARVRPEDRERIVRSLYFTAGFNGWSQAADAAAVLRASGMPRVSEWFAQQEKLETRQRAHDDMVRLIAKLWGTNKLGQHTRDSDAAVERIANRMLDAGYRSGDEDTRDYLQLALDKARDQGCSGNVALWVEAKTETD